MGHQKVRHGWAAVRALGRRFASSTRGNVAMMFGAALPVILMITVGGVDLHQAAKVKAELQDALDAAALAAARSNFSDDANINRIGMAALRANMPEYFRANPGDTANFRITNTNTVTADAVVQVKTIVANVILPPYGQVMDDYLPIGTRSEVLRASRDVEVAMALDITGSMEGSALRDLKAAAVELIDIVVQDQQTPFYSKLALVPYASGVNLGERADQARGSLDESFRSISSATWITGSIRTVSGITRSSTATVSASSHGFSTGDRVVMWSVNGMTALNGVPFAVERTSSSQFRLRHVNASGATGGYVSTSGLSNFSGSAYVAECARSDCHVSVTASGHGLVEDDYVRLADLGGLNQLNGAGFRVTRLSTASQLVLDASRSLVLSNAPKGGNSWSGGGKVFNGADGHLWRVFPTDGGMVNVHSASTCVSERSGAQAYTDAAPTGSARVGRSYPDAGNACPSATVAPLGSDRDALKARINAFSASGSTAGQIGIAWTWYMISPNFGSLWPSEARPAPYNPARTLKAVILMTDGEFNSPYRDGLIAADAGSGSGGADTHIALDASNGDPFTQSVRLCEAMRRQNVVIYTVGFNISNATGRPGVDTAKEVMEACATSRNHAFLANSGTDLKEAFRAIGRDITRLRIAR